MSRKNRRIYSKPKMLPPIKMNTNQGRHDDRSRCAFCGRLLGAYEWHWIWDEFGQRCRKCNDEKECYRRRRSAAEAAYRKAIRLR
ncbi:MAG: hypothetical protein LKI17_06255 [Megasphaera cerevisiae]|nr:hypothetical protein [Megasphaera cerevisiae]